MKFKSKFVHMAWIPAAIFAGMTLSGCIGGNLVEGTYEKNTNLGAPVTFTDHTGKVGGTFQMTIGYGSSAFHNPKDLANIFYTSSDRGPNIKCEDSGDAPVNLKDFCGSVDSTGTFQVDNDGKIFPDPAFDPSIYKFMLIQAGGTMEPSLIETIRLADKDGNPIRGLSNDLPDRPKDLTDLSQGNVANTENGYSNTAKRLPFNQNSLDTEGMAQLSDGSFWVGEEYAPSIVHVAADGRIIERIVPNDSGLKNPITGESMSVCDALKFGTAQTPAANYPIICGLPGILDLRSLNRGIEDVAVSPDGKTLYFGMQSPLANPSKDAYKKSRNARIFTVALKGNGNFKKVTGEYVYQLDTPDTFPADFKNGKPQKQNNVKLSEMSVAPNGHLIQLERISKETKLYHSDFSKATNILGSKWDDRATQPSLTEQTDLAAAGIVPVTKTLVFNTTTDYPDAQSPGKVEGVAFLSDQFMLLTNDNDFGISADPSKFFVVKATQQVEK